MDKSGTSAGKHVVFPSACTLTCPQLTHRRLFFKITTTVFMCDGFTQLGAPRHRLYALKLDISTLPETGHFYFALTGSCISYLT